MNKDVNLSENLKILMDMIGDWKSADLGDKARNELRKKFHNDNNRYIGITGKVNIVYRWK